MASEEVGDYLNPVNQARLVKKFLDDHKFFMEVEHITNPEDFVSPYSEFVHMIKDYYKANKRSPNIDEFKAYLDSEDHQKNYDLKLIRDNLPEIEAIDLINIENNDWWSNNMVHFVKKSRTVQMFYEGVEWLDKSISTEKDYEYFASKMSEIHNIAIQKNEIHDWKRDASQRFSYFGEYEQNRIESDIAMLNDIGFGDYEALSLFLGETNIGKTLYLANYVATALRGGNNVVVFTMEDGAKKWAGRVDQNIMQMTRDDLLLKGKEALTPFKRKVLDQYGDLKVISLPTGTGNVTMMREYLDQLKREEGFEPNMIVADYLGIMAPTQSYNNSYEKYKMVAEEFRSLGQEYRAACVSAQQFNRGAFGADGGKKNKPGVDNVQDSIGIPQTADAIVAIFNISDEDNNKNYLTPEKSRSTNKRKVKSVVVEVDTDRQTIKSTAPIDDKDIPRDVRKEKDKISKTLSKPVDKLKMNVSKKDTPKKKVKVKEGSGINNQDLDDLIDSLT